METPSTRDIWLDGLWRNNAGLVQLLGLCPLLAVSTTIARGIGLGLATTATLCLSGLLVAALRRWISAEIRIPIYVVIIASVVTIIELLLNAYAFELYQALGIFLPLIVTNCAIIGRAETFASRATPLNAVADGLATGLGFSAVLVALSAVREILGRGTMLSELELLVGEAGRTLELDLSGLYAGFQPALLPPGAFLCLGLMVAAKRFTEQRRADRGQAAGSAPMDAPA